MVYLFQIEQLIKKLATAGVNVYKDDYIIMASKKVKFDEDVYPLEIVTSNIAPDDSVYLMKRPEKMLEDIFAKYASSPKMPTAEEIEQAIKNAKLAESIKEPLARLRRLM